MLNQIYFKPNYQECQRQDLQFTVEYTKENSFICKNKAVKYLQFSQQMLYIVNPEFKSLIMKSSPGNSNIHSRMSGLLCSHAILHLGKHKTRFEQLIQASHSL